MFIKLRKKILLLNMALISVVMLLAFAAVYTITWRNMQLENRRILGNQEIAAVSFMSSSHEGSTAVVLHDNGLTVSMESYIPDNSFESGFISIRQVSLDYSLSFSVEIDDNGHIVTIYSIIDMTHESYESAAQRVLAQNRDFGTISLDGRDWMYKIAYQESRDRLADYPQVADSLMLSSGINRQISFLDITESIMTLRRLMITLSLVGVVVLIVFYFISLFFSGRAVKPIAEAWDKQKHFIADASHELKTPLTIINANCDALLESGRETVDSQRKWIDYILAGTDRMARLTGQLLTLAKMDDKSRAITFDNVDISKLANESIQSMEAMADKRCLNVEQNIEPDVVIKSDGEKIAAIYTALLENAVKYADNSIYVNLCKDRRRVFFSVANDGCSISKEDLPKVFDRFFKCDKSREGNDSYGLGLSITKTIVESLSGDITVVSEVGGNTVFTVVLPVPRTN